MKKLPVGMMAVLAILAGCVPETPRMDTAQQVRQWLAALNDADNAANRLVGAEMLGRLGPAADAAVPALIQALDDPSREVRFAAVKSLVAIGADARDALPVLEKMQITGDAVMRQAVVNAVTTIKQKSVNAHRK